MPTNWQSIRRAIGRSLASPRLVVALLTLLIAPLLVGMLLLLLEQHWARIRGLEERIEDMKGDLSIRTTDELACSGELRRRMRELHACNEDFEDKGDRLKHASERIAQMMEGVCPYERYSEFRLAHSGDVQAFRVSGCPPDDACATVDIERFPVGPGDPVTIAVYGSMLGPLNPVASCRGQEIVFERFVDKKLLDARHAEDCRLILDVPLKRGFRFGVEAGSIDLTVMVVSPDWNDPTLGFAAEFRDQPVADDAIRVVLFESLEAEAPYDPFRGD